jgi:hypothetical protein
MILSIDLVVMWLGSIGCPAASRPGGRRVSLAPRYGSYHLPRGHGNVVEIDMRVCFLRGGESTRRATSTGLAVLLAALLPARSHAQTWPARPGSPAQPSTSAAPTPPMQAGGLAPPPSMQAGGLAPPSSGPGPTEVALAEAERRDSGRGLEFFYFQPEIGITYAALDALHGPLFPEGAKASGFGPAVGAAAGLRLIFLTIGPRIRFAHFSDFDLLTVDLEFAWRVPLGRLDPYGFLGIGYANLGTDLIPAKTVDGYNVRLGGGVDYYVTGVLSVGGSATAEIVRLKPSGGAYALGLAFTASAVLGLHF